jgi:hypothetical protein
MEIWKTYEGGTNEEKFLSEIWAVWKGEWLNEVDYFWESIVLTWSDCLSSLKYSIAQEFIDCAQYCRSQVEDSVDFLYFLYQRTMNNWNLISSLKEICNPMYSAAQSIEVVQ